jgi:hypothetical protein
MLSLSLTCQIINIARFYYNLTCYKYLCPYNVTFSLTHELTPQKLGSFNKWVVAELDEYFPNSKEAEDLLASPQANSTGSHHESWEYTSHSNILFFVININVILSINHRSHKWSLPFRFPDIFSMQFFCPMPGTYYFSSSITWSS